MKLRNLYLMSSSGSELQLMYTSKSKMQEPSTAIVQRLEEGIKQRAAGQQQQQQQHYSTCCTLNLLSGPPFTPLRCVRSSAATTGKYRVLCRAVAMWPPDRRQWTHWRCGRCGDRTRCSDVTAVEPGSASSSSSACRACGGLNSRRCGWGFSLLLEDATALLQAEVWGARAVSSNNNTARHSTLSPRSASLHWLVSSLSIHRRLLTCPFLCAGRLSLCVGW